MSTQNLGDVYFQKLSCGSFAPPAECIADRNIEDAARINPTKLQERLRSSAGQKNGTNNVAQRQVICVIHGNVGTVRAVYARNTTAAAGSDSTSVQIKKNGTNILTAPLLLDLAAAANVQSTVSFTSAALVAGDVLEVDISLSGTTVGQGVFVEVVHDEDNQ